MEAQETARGGGRGGGRRGSGGLGGRRWLCQGSDQAEAGQSSRNSLGSVETGQDLNRGFAVPVA